MACRVPAVQVRVLGVGDRAGSIAGPLAEVRHFTTGGRLTHHTELIIVIRLATGLASDEAEILSLDFLAWLGLESVELIQ